MTGILVLGLGNILCRDEGVGVRIVEALLERHDLPPAVTVVDGGTCGMDLLDTIAGHDTLIVADAIRKDGAPPGSVIRLADAEVAAFFQSRISPHQLGLCDVLAALALTDEAPRHVVLIGVVPENLDLGISLTPVVTRAIEPALDAILAALSQSGLGPPVKAGCEERLDELVVRFRDIGETRMKDLPVFNPALSVEAVGFQPFRDDWLGVLITPWFMNMILLPKGKKPFDMAGLGRRQTVALPGAERVFVEAGDEVCGQFRSCSLHSPVGQFVDQDAARIEAEALLADATTICRDTSDPAIAKPAVSRRAFLRGDC